MLTLLDSSPPRVTAVGSLFAANLAQLDDVEVWAYDLARAHAYLELFA